MYNRLLAIEYAKKWAFSFNPKYYNFSSIGGDCTNFVSQCLHAGNIPMNYSEYGWFYSSTYNRAPAWTGVNEFWDFATTNPSIGIKLLPCTLSELEVGDVIQLYNGFRYYHTLLVSSTDNGIKVTAHDYGAFNKPLDVYNFVSLRSAKVTN